MPATFSEQNKSFARIERKHCAAGTIQSVRFIQAIGLFRITFTLCWVWIQASLHFVHRRSVISFPYTGSFNRTLFRQLLRSRICMGHGRLNDFHFKKIRPLCNNICWDLSLTACICLYVFFSFSFQLFTFWNPFWKRHHKVCEQINLLTWKMTSIPTLGGKWCER